MVPYLYISEKDQNSQTLSQASDRNNSSVCHHRSIRAELRQLHPLHRLPTFYPKDQRPDEQEGGYPDEAIQGKEPDMAREVRLYPLLQIRQSAGGLGKEFPGRKIQIVQVLQGLCAGWHTGAQTDGRRLPGAGGFLLYQ